MIKENFCILLQGSFYSCVIYYYLGRQHIFGKIIRNSQDNPLRRPENDKIPACLLRFVKIYFAASKI